MDDSGVREFDFSSRDFAWIVKLAHESTGIVIGSSKYNMVYARLARRLRELRLVRFKDYIALLESPAGEDELSAFVNAITTNLTRFFREPHHFEHLASTLAKIREHAGTLRRLRIWSAGCSSGEEPYSIAMTLRDHMADLPRWDVRILATDLDTNMLGRGSAGQYSVEAVADIPRDRLRRHFTESASAAGAGYRANDELRRMIVFKQLNLLGDWPMKGAFDAIFCRNVMIYFDNPTKANLIYRLGECLKPESFLYIGHSETLLDQQDRFKLCGRTLYRKLAG